MAHYSTPWNRSYGYNKWVLFITCLVMLIFFSLPFLGHMSTETIKMKNQQKVMELQDKGFQVEVK